MGCSSDFLFNGGAVDCDAIATRIERMQETIAQLQQQVQSSGDESDRRRALTEQYNAYCAGAPSDGQIDAPVQDLQTLPIDPDAPASADEASPDAAAPHAGHVRALCVRHCDGGYFPITDDASSGSIAGFDQLCKALCPGTEASLYTAAPATGIETAVAPDGTPYTALPAAFKFQKSFDATCACKPVHQSWVEALADAEALIERRRGDVTVTQRMSDAMSRPAASAAGASPTPPEKSASKAHAARKAKAPMLAPLRPSVAGRIAAPGPARPDITEELRPDVPTL